ncbi:DUF6172 family protein [Sulfurovum sp. zt1-1]|uniref:DUF6172 family protein n=1 Tax=Sulfurovum zhangzhouensis TaxID=3019067 RepID=A0ABT7QZ38_9BACT|nr:DUF6172 family protein [Sulfurovum zhangzhouensis]MDM5271551.1 DUF6172 family protein [Sulfurovum zhangzhouensis]
MKKTFKLQDEKRHPDRIVEAIKHEIRKYIKRERGKKLPDAEKMFWNFDCKFGDSAQNAEIVTFNSIIEGLDKVVEAGWTECYIEIISRAEVKPPRDTATTTNENADTL